LVELVGGAGASDSPKVVAAMVAGVGRNGQAAAIQIARGVDGRQRGERVGLGWVGLTDPNPSRLA
jgi:hypothetical protein